MANNTDAIHNQSDSMELERTRLLSMFENMPNPVAKLSGPSHLFKYANTKYRQMFLEGRDYKNKTVAEVLPEAREQGFVALLDKVFLTGEAFAGNEIQYNFIDHNNRTKTVFLNFVYEPMRNSDGTVEGILAAITDVTEGVVQRRKVQEAAIAMSIEKRKLDLIVNEAPIGVALLSGPELRFEIANEVWQSLVPNKREYFGRTYDEIYPELVDTGLSKIMKKVFDTGETFTANEMLVSVSKDNGELEDRYYDFSYLRMTDAQDVPYGVFSIATNVTERVLSKVALSEAKLEAERANHLKSAFLANMSHEIRTPLGAMIGFADLIREQGLTASERANYANIMLRNGEQLSVIINDILDLSKVEAGHLSLEYIDTHHTKIGSEVMSLMQVKAREKDLAFEYNADDSAPDVITSDPTRVRQIVLNIVANAIKFTQYGAVKIRSYGGPASDGKQTLCFEVSDTGIGMTLAQIDRLFQTFSQADETTTRRFGGTGLGLALSRKLARSLGGDITVKKSSEGIGSTFLVTIVDQPEKKSSATGAFKREVDRHLEVGENSLSGLRILSVDDSPDNQALLWNYLTKQGASVAAVDNGILGVKAALAGNFDLVLMDIQMPVMDGYTATQKLRDAGYQKPIIALTAHAMTEIRKKALNVGYTDHLTKPIDRVDLIHTILRHTRNGEAR